MAPAAGVSVRASPHLLNCALAAQQQIGGYIDHHADNQSGRQADTRQAQAAIEDHRDDHAQRAADGQRNDEQITASTSLHQPQPAQRVVEDAGVEENLRGELDQPAAHQRVECLVVRAIGRRVACFIMRQGRRVETIVRDPHRLRPIADQRPNDVQRVRLPFGRLDGRVRLEHQIYHAFPNQRAHGVGALRGAENSAEPAHVAFLAEIVEWALRYVEDRQEDQTGEGQTDQAKPGCPHVARKPTQRSRHRCPPLGPAG